MNLSYSIAFSQPTFIGGEFIYLLLTLVNMGTEPVKIPDPRMTENWIPVYEISGPGISGKNYADLRRGVHSHDIEPPKEGEAVLLELQPGETWERQVILNRFIDLQEGHYEVRSVISWKGEKIESNIVGFDFENLKLKELSFGVWEDPIRNSAVGVWIHKGVEEEILFQGRYDELKGDEGGYRNSGSVRRQKFQESISDPLTQSTNYSSQRDLFIWIFWREENKILAFSNMVQDPFEFEIDENEAIETVISPALMDVTHNADVFVVTTNKEKQKKMSVVRFSDPKSDSGQPPRIINELYLPESATSFAIALDPAGLKNKRHVVYATQEEEDVVKIHQVSLSEEGGASEVVDFTFNRARIIPDSKLGIIVETDGMVRVGTFLGTSFDDRLYYFVELIFDPNTNLRRPTVNESIELESRATAVRVNYSREAEGKINGNWVLWTEDGELFASKKMQPRLIKNKIDQEKTKMVLPLAGSFYLLNTSREKGVVLEELP